MVLRFYYGFFNSSLFYSCKQALICSPILPMIFHIKIKKFKEGILYLFKYGDKT